MTKKTVRGDEAAQAVAWAMREASALAILYSAAVARRLKISSSDLECLDFIAANQPVSAGALAKACGLTTGAITGVLDRLERAGLAVRERSPEDRRQIKVRVTGKFETDVVPLFEPMARHQRRAVASLSADDQRTVADFVTSAVAAARAALDDLKLV